MQSRAQQSRSAYGLLDILLQARGLCEYHTVKDAAGRPHIAGHPRLDFSIAHTNFLAVCALAVGETGENAPRVGVDAEPCGSVTAAKALALSARFFAPAEQAALQACTPAELPELFLRIFTQKEAYAKFVGTGLAKTLGTDTLDLEFTHKTGLHFRHFKEFDHYITLCFSKEISTVTLCS